VRSGRVPSCHHVACLTLAGLAVLFAAARPAPAASQMPDAAADMGRTVVALDVKAAHSEFAPDAEAVLLALINECRAGHHVPPVVMSALLRNVAREHSREMALEGFAGHGSPLGQSFLDRVSRVIPPGRFVGENVTVAVTVEDANRAFTASAGHLENILDPRFHSVGIGVASADSLGYTITEDFSQ